MNDHGLPLAMYSPEERICVTLEVVTGVGGRSERGEDRALDLDRQRGRVEKSGELVEMETPVFFYFLP